MLSSNRIPRDCAKKNGNICYLLQQTMPWQRGRSSSSASEASALPQGPPAKPESARRVVRLPKPKKEKMKERGRAALQGLIDAKLLTPGVPFSIRVMKENVPILGTILPEGALHCELDGKAITGFSPSRFAMDVQGVACSNGWMAVSYRRPNGSWVTLDSLRAILRRRA